MLKLTKTGIGLLTNQYRSVLRKCLLLNLGLMFLSNYAFGHIDDSCIIDNGNGTVSYNCGYASSETGGGIVVGFDVSQKIHYLPFSSYGITEYTEYRYFYKPSSGSVVGFTLSSVVALDSKLYSVENQLLNYYYTFRVDERDEVIEFAKELRSNKKEMSSLDFMPIKSSSDLRINLIKSEDSLTFSAKTRDDSLVLMEVCHA